MARSGSRDFKLNRNDLITKSFQVINLYDLSSSIPNTDMDFAATLLNAMIKHWQTNDIYLWNRKEATLFTAKDTSQYAIGSTGTHATNTYVSTQINGALASGVNSFTVDSTTGMAVSDNVGIELSDGTRQWTTIATIPDSTTFTTADNTTATVNDDAYVVSYTTKIYKPLLVIHARRKLLTGDSEITMHQLRRNDYFTISDKTAGGQPNVYYYDKQLDNGQIYLWPRPNDVDQIVNFTYYESIEDMDTSTDDFDFPQEYTMALIWGLAAELAQAYGMYPELDKIQMKAAMLLRTASEFNYDEESVLISPNTKGPRIVR